MGLASIILKWFVSKLANFFELGDHEYMRGELFVWPFTIWLTVIEPRYRHHGWRRIFVFRIRLAIVTLISQRVFNTCTLCNRSFSWAELLDRPKLEWPGKLIYFQSGSICHTACSRESVDASKRTCLA